MFKTIAFDLGGVYFLGRRTKGFKETIKENYPKINEKQIKDFMKFATAYSKGLMNKKTFTKFTKKIFNFNSEKVSEFFLRWFNCYIENKKLRKLILKLKSKYRIVTISGNMRDRIRYLNKKYGFLKLFQMKIFSYNVGARKKDTLIYRKMLEKIAHHPSQVLFIDNQIVHLNVAKKLGIGTILFKNNKQLVRDFKKLKILR